MPDPSTAGVPRRRFLGQVAATLAAGFGFAALGSTAAAAALRGGGPQSCAIYCSPLSCDYCGTGNHLFECVDSVCGSDPYQTCMSRACSGFCSSPNAC